MKKFIILLSTFLAIPATWAQPMDIEPLLNKVTLQLTAEQWVNTKTAVVTVGINASLSNTGLEKIHTTVLTRLNQLSNKGEWHIISYNRNLDRSGLETIQMNAQARLPYEDLAGIRDKAKSMSKPGEAYSVDNIQFTPSEDEVRDVRLKLRQVVYDQAKNEIAQLNKTYPEQKYILHDINFMTDAMPMGVNMMAKSGSFANPLAVGEKLHVTATVVLASIPDLSTLKTQPST